MKVFGLEWNCFIESQKDINVICFCLWCGRQKTLLSDYFGLLVYSSWITAMVSEIIIGWTAMKLILVDPQRETKQSSRPTLLSWLREVIEGTLNEYLKAHFEIFDVVLVVGASARCRMQPNELEDTSVWLGIKPNRQCYREQGLLKSTAVLRWAIPHFTLSLQYYTSHFWGRRCGYMDFSRTRWSD